ncbi:MAG: hypothetical protein R3C45_19175 [Phycisphaerales bacterium]
MNTSRPASTRSASPTRWRRGTQLAPYLGYPAFASDPLSYNIFTSPELVRVRSTIYRCPEDEREQPVPVYAPPDSFLSYGKASTSSCAPMRPTRKRRSFSTGKPGRHYRHPRPSATAVFGEIAGGEFGVDHVMAHFWLLGRTEPGDGLNSHATAPPPTTSTPTATRKASPSTSPTTKQTR